MAMRNPPKKRNSNELKRRPIIVIAAEGNNKTERIYFTDFGRENKRAIKWAPGNYTDPAQMASVLAETCKSIEWMPEMGDRAYCLIDSDFSCTKDRQIKKAEQALNEYGMQLLVSSPCFEIWYLCHHHANARQYSNAEVIREVKKYYPAYEKSLPGMYAATKERLQTAIQNAEKLRAACMDRGYQPHTVDFCPSTEIDILAKELMRQER